MTLIRLIHYDLLSSLEKKTRCLLLHLPTYKINQCRLLLGLFIFQLQFKNRLNCKFGPLICLRFRFWSPYNLIHQLSPSFMSNPVILVSNPEIGPWLLVVNVDRHVSCFYWTSKPSPSYSPNKPNRNCQTWSFKSMIILVRLHFFLFNYLFNCASSCWEFSFVWLLLRFSCSSCFNGCWQKKKSCSNGSPSSLLLSS